MDGTHIIFSIDNSLFEGYIVSPLCGIK